MLCIVKYRIYGLINFDNSLSQVDLSSILLTELTTSNKVGSHSTRQADATFALR